MDNQTTIQLIDCLTTIDLAQVEEHIRWQLGGRVRDLRLLVREGSLVLQGHAKTYYTKQLAQHAVMDTLTLPIGANEIEVS